MAARELPIPSDPTLLADIRQYGKFDTAGCYQCGSCTLSCELVTNPASFPRKSIRLALVGLRTPLLASLEPWLCQDCGDCSAVCPREAEPQISMQTLRNFLSAHYDWTGMTSRILRSRRWYFGSQAFVAAVVVALILWYHLSRVGMSFSDFATMPLGLDHMFPIMTYFTRVVILVPVFLLLSRVFRIQRFVTTEEERARIPFTAYVSEAWRYVDHCVTQELIRKCTDKSRWLGHWMVSLGTVMMLTVKVFGLRWFQTDNIYPFYHPQRWVGYLAAGFVVYGLGKILARRIRMIKDAPKNAYLEQFALPVLLLCTALSGITVHILRYAGLALAAHIVYALHVIIATPMLVVEMPFGHWAHMIHRPLILYFQAVKARAQQPGAPEEGLSYGD